LSRSTDVAVRLLGGDPYRDREEVTEEEIRDMVAGQTNFTPKQRLIIDGAFEIAERTIEQVLRPRGDVFFLEADQPGDEALAALAASGHSRAPVCDGSPDEVIGFVHLRDLLDRDGSVVRDVVNDIRAFPETADVLDVLHEMQTGRAQLAMVVDEHGPTAGIITVEDLVEELVGAVSDEHDEHEEQDVIDRGAGTWSVSGLLRPDEVSARTGLAVPADRHYETIGGLVLHQLGRIPEPGDRVTALRQLPPELAGEAEGHPGGVWVEVESLDGTRVDRALVGALPPGGPDDGEPA
jgi:CBS domain containing-hemolysin-like protein